MQQYSFTISYVFDTSHKYHTIFRTDALKVTVSKYEAQSTGIQHASPQHLGVFMYYLEFPHLFFHLSQTQLLQSFGKDHSEAW